LLSLLDPRRVWGQASKRPTADPAIAEQASAARLGSAAGGVVHPLHVAPRAKHVIHLYQAGGPSQLELFDWKPKLAAMHGQPMPESFTKGQPIAQLQDQELRCFGPQHEFARYGASGQELSTLLPRIGELADEICVIRSMQTRPPRRRLLGLVRDRLRGL
jgi:hypothetical protein